jgi:hypothetical protein
LLIGPQLVVDHLCTERVLLPWQLHDFRRVIRHQRKDFLPLRKLLLKTVGPRRQSLDLAVSLGDLCFVTASVILLFSGDGLCGRFGLHLLAFEELLILFVELLLG